MRAIKKSFDEHQEAEAEQQKPKRRRVDYHGLRGIDSGRKD